MALRGDYGGAGLTVELDDLEALFWLGWFWDFNCEWLVRIKLFDFPSIQLKVISSRMLTSHCLWHYCLCRVGQYQNTGKSVNRHLRLILIYEIFYSNTKRNHSILDRQNSSSLPLLCLVIPSAYILFNSFPFLRISNFYSVMTSQPLFPTPSL